MNDLITNTITVELIAALKAARTLPWHGIHGVAHWRRVRENGLRLASLNGADATIVELFAFLHDIKRRNDGFDPEHGQRAADFIRTLDGSLIRLTGDRLESLIYACAHHTDGTTEAELTIQTCWDADRLDLGRVGIRPDPTRLCTAAAKDPAILRWAILRSRERRP